MDRTITAMWVKLFDFAWKAHSLNHQINKGRLLLLLGLRTWTMVDMNIYSTIWWYSCQVFKIFLSFLLIFVYKNLFDSLCYFNKSIAKLKYSQKIQIDMKIW